jgi:hypothetical protein
MTDLNVPGGLNAIKPDADGTTGLRGYISPFPDSEIKNILTNADYGQYIPDIWDCEQRAFWGISQVRCKLYGCPIGAAIGKIQEASYSSSSEMHTLIIYWKHLGGNNYQQVYFDPGLNRETTAFIPHIIIPFPVFRPSQPDIIRNEFLPFANNRIDSGYLALNTNYTFVKADTIINRLKNLQDKCKEPDNPPIAYRFSEDRALWASNHVRREFAFDKQGGISLPVGVAFGKVGSKDIGAIVIFNENDPAIFLDADNFQPISSFTPRIIIV